MRTRMRNHEGERTTTNNEPPPPPHPQPPLRATARGVETRSNKGRDDDEGTATGTRMRHKNGTRGPLQETKAAAYGEENQQKGPRDVVGKFFPPRFIFFCYYTTIRLQGGPQGPRRGRRPRPPTTTASNCSWGGNGEQRWGKDRTTTTTMGMGRTSHHQAAATAAATRMTRG
jgi:hypothetical protein